jgi:hypothetical protein
VQPQILDSYADPAPEALSSVDAYWMLPFAPRHGLAVPAGPVLQIATHRGTRRLRFGRPTEDTPRPWRLERFDRASRLVERDRFDADGNLADRTIFAYDQEGKPRGAARFDISGTPLLDIVYNRDPAGRITAITGRDARGREEIVRRFTYDAAGSLATVSDRRPRETIEWTLTARVDGMISEAFGQIYKDDIECARVAFTYDGGGNLSTGRSLDAHGTPLHAWRYIYDGPPAQGNWTRRRFPARADDAATGDEQIIYRRFTFRG